MPESFDTVYCRNCRMSIPATSAICPRCRADQRVAPQPPQQARVQPRMRPRLDKERPSGITIVGVLMILNALGLFMMMCAILAVGKVARDQARHAADPAALSVAQPPASDSPFKGMDPAQADMVVKVTGAVFFFGGAINLGKSPGRPGAVIVLVKARGGGKLRFTVAVECRKGRAGNRA